MTQDARRPAGDGIAEQVRNVVLVGPGGAGKTMLIEAILAATGAISRPGSIENGTTVCDFEDVERRVGRSVSLAVASTEVNGAAVDSAAADWADRSGPASIWSTPQGTPISSVSCGPVCGPRMRRCSSSPRRMPRPRPHPSTAPPGCSGRNAPTSGCRVRSSSPTSISRAVTSPPPWRTANWSSATAFIRSICLRARKFWCADGVDRTAVADGVPDRRRYQDR